MLGKGRFANEGQKEFKRYKTKFKVVNCYCQVSWTINIFDLINSSLWMVSFHLQSYVPYSIRIISWFAFVQNTLGIRSWFACINKNVSNQLGQKVPNFRKSTKKSRKLTKCLLCLQLLLKRKGCRSRNLRHFNHG